MNARERLTATLKGDPVDRPAISFYELDGFSQDPANNDPMNIFSHPSWKPLLDLAHEKTDCIYNCGLPFKKTGEDPQPHCEKVLLVKEEDSF